MSLSGAKVKKNPYFALQMLFFLFRELAQRIMGNKWTLTPSPYIPSATSHVPL